MTLVDDLRECGNDPLSYGQETHGELHLAAIARIEKLTQLVAQALAVAEAALLQALKPDG